MNIKSLVFKTSLRISIALILMSLLMAGISFYLKIGFFISLMFFVIGVFGACFVFIFTNKLKKDLISSLLVGFEEGAATLEELKDINKAMKEMSVKVDSSKEQLDIEKKRGKEQIDTIIKIFGIASEDIDIDLKVSSILEKLLYILKANNYYLFTIDEITNCLIKKDSYRGGLEDLQNISLDKNKEILVKIFYSKVPVILKELRTREDMPAYFRNWAIKNSIDSLYGVCVKVCDNPYVLILFTGGNFDNLSCEQKNVLQAGLSLIGNLYREDNHLKSLDLKFFGIKIENKICSTALRAHGFEELCRDIIKDLANFIPLDWGGISIPCKENNENIYINYSLLLKEDDKSLKRSVLQAENSGVEWVKNNKKQWVEEDLNISKPFFEDEMYTFENLKSRIITPIFKGNLFLGALSVASKKLGIYNHEHLYLMERIAKILSDEIEKSQVISKLNRKTEDLQKVNFTMEEYYQKIGHELRNPLSMLSNMSYMILEKAGKMTPLETENTLKFLSNEIEKLRSSIQKIVFFNRAQSGKMLYNPEKFYFIEVLHGVMIKFQSLAEERNVRIKVDIPKGMPEIMGDREKLRYIIQELIGNALLNTDKGGIVTVKSNLIPRSWLKEKAKNYFPKDVLRKMDLRVDQVLVSVINTGKKVSKEKINDIFESPMSSLEKAQDKSNGLKIGLPLVKELVEMHRGSAWVQDLSGRGLRFSFNIPQFDFNWFAIREVLVERVRKARQNLDCLSVIAVVIRDIDHLKMTDKAFSIFIKEVERVVRSQIREPLDYVALTQDNESILIIGKADAVESKAIQKRLFNVIKKMRSEIVEKIPAFEFVSLTYPEEVLSADELLDMLNKRINRISRNSI